MFGKNQRLAPIESDGSRIEMKEVFYSIQGEGPHAGRPAIFLRAAGCNLACWFCDTPFDSKWTPSVEEILAEMTIETASLEKRPSCDVKVRPSLVVITGGEPLRQNLDPLISELNANGLEVQIETAGTLCPSWITKHFFRKGEGYGRNTIVCSPKLSRVHPALVPFVTAWKYIVSEKGSWSGDGLPRASTQGAESCARESGIYRPWEDPIHPGTTARDFPVYVQPLCEYMPGSQLLIDSERTFANALFAAEIAMRFGYRVSLQMHKYLNMR